MSVPIQSVKFWLNAFIPQHISGYTRAVPGSPGLTMIPGPQRPILTPTGTPLIGQTRVEISDCYYTDQRRFSNQIHAKSRMHAEVRVNFTVSPPTITQWHDCDYTTECDCEDGDIECHEKGRTSRMSFTLRPMSVPTTASPTPHLMFPSPVMVAGAPKTGVAVLDMELAASNPCAPTSRVFGDIDAKGVITIDLASRSIDFNGLIDQFPAFEAYATINDGSGIAMFQIPPPPGNTVMNLPGPPNRPVHCRLEDRDGDGVFETLSALP